MTNIQFYNGGGTSQWTEAGLPLVTTLSILPQCANLNDDNSSLVVEEKSITGCRLCCHDVANDTDAALADFSSKNPAMLADTEDSSSAAVILHNVLWTVLVFSPSVFLGMAFL
jgi:hypothetical protein